MARSAKKQKTKEFREDSWPVSGLSCIFPAGKIRSLLRDAGDGDGIGRISAGAVRALSAASVLFVQRVAEEAEQEAGREGADAVGLEHVQRAFLSGAVPAPPGSGVLEVTEREVPALPRPGQKKGAAIQAVGGTASKNRGKSEAIKVVEAATEIANVPADVAWAGGGNREIVADDEDYD
mmetsp:Transcript_41182/g.80601  ORF Transcript_41182/g.80601 Transcript_41182/m.80601 type:complete len:179 (+) Transcript_41182:103-639(+)|eukprot:CAMPEP_0194328570 /NCGR_PEP_ID=MMETSP0171-20130528/45309_1 /TAXON_ID=218684 /ORGANISM="Corethron pennatum, Strain L29A3" /LENGTH=178 /DNA_ID=CAMNT_0039088973 /DNA_START=49 /DNA_END=585 /DNA_ORIENTATION=+